MSEQVKIMMFMDLQSSPKEYGLVIDAKLCFISNKSKAVT
jgi:hypothetical protein